MDKSEKLESDDQSIKVEVEVMDIKLEELHHSIDIKEETSIDESQMDEQFECGYYFVLFNKDNSAAVVPCSWVIKIEEEETYNCFWPGVSINRDMIRNCVPPKLNWECHRITIQGRFDSYETANQAIEDFYGEDNGEHRPSLRESTKRKFPDDEKEASPPAEKKCTRLKITNNGQWNRKANHLRGTINNVDEDLSNTERGDLEEQIEAKFSHLCCKMLFQELSHLKSLVQRTLSKVTLIEQRLANNERKRKTYRFAHMTPVKTIEDLQSIENNTRDLKDAKDELRIWFLSIGGENPKDFIVRCLQRFFSNKLGIGCSWTGQKKNYKLKNLKIMATMLDACKELFPNWTDKEYELCVQDWFRHCMQRYKRECPNREDSQ